MQSGCISLPHSVSKNLTLVSHRMVIPLAAEEVDKDLGKPQKKAKKQREELAGYDLGEELKKLLVFTRQHRVALEHVETEVWDEVESARPGLVKRLTVELDRLASFLRS